jgi:hypothetical protein
LVLSVSWGASRAITFLPDSGNPDAADDEYSIAVDAARAFTPPGFLLPALLHELTHVVDPRFEEDTREKQEAPRKRSAQEEYALASEQRAFTAMWIDELTREMKRGTFADVKTFIEMTAGLSEEFRAFLTYGPTGVREQVAYHFRKMSEAVTTRDPFFLGSALSAYQRKHDVADDALAALLRCAPSVLTGLRLCRRPGTSEDRTAEEDISDISRRWGVDASMLTQIMAEPASRLTPPAGPAAGLGLGPTRRLA